MVKFSQQSIQVGLAVLLALVVVVAAAAAAASGEQQPARAAAAEEPIQEESYQKVYEAFTKLMQNVGNNSLGNARRLVSRLNQLVAGGTDKDTSAGRPAPVAATAATPRPAPLKEQQSADEKTEQILNRLDSVNNNTDQHTLRQLNEDVNRLVTSLSDAYLRNIRRVIERVNRTIGSSSSSSSSSPSGGQVVALHQSGDRLTEDGQPKQPGFPGWDEFIVAVDRMQKSLATFVRSSTRLITSGR